MTRLKQLLLTVLVITGWWAQQGNGQTLESELLRKISPIDQSLTSTSMLLERIPQYAPTTVFNGRVGAEKVVTGYKMYSMLYGQLDKMFVDTNQGMPMEMDTLLKRLKNFKKSDTIELSAMYYRYDRFKPNAVEDNLLMWGQDSLLYDVPGRPESPFMVDTLLYFTLTGWEREGKEQDFHWNPELMFTNTATPWSDMEIDFGDGSGFHIVEADSIISVVYPDFDTFQVVLRYILPSGDTLKTYSKISIAPELGGMPPLGDDLDAPVVVREITNADGTEGVTISHFNNNLCPDTRIRKPLIFIDGFDPTDNHNDSTIQNMITNPIGANSPTLSRLLNDDEYDLFYINFINSTIDIRRNAQYVREAIEWINEQKHEAYSYERNIVMGNSMGGVVGKWALRTMEIDGVDHETELYITNDGAMRGANIPLAMQIGLKHVSDFSFFGKKVKNFDFAEGIAAGRRSLDSKAARQMLYYHWDSDAWNLDDPDHPIQIISAEDLAHQHDTFYEEFRALGDLDIREIAISDGAIKNVTEGADGDDKDQKFNPGDVLLAQSLNLLTVLLAGADWSDEFWDSVRKAIKGTVLQALTNTQFDAVLKALKNGESSDVYFGRISYSIFGHDVEQILICFVREPRPYDSAPGGMTTFKSPDGQGGAFDAFKFKFDAFCFIPTISSLQLDIEDPYFEGHDLTQKGNYLKIHTPLDDYNGSVDIEDRIFDGANAITIPNEINQPHVTFDEHLLSRWLADVLRRERLQSPLENRTFNFGRVTDPTDIDYPGTKQTKNAIDFDLDVKSNGKLWSNRMERIAYTDNQANPENGEGKRYDVFIQRHRCDLLPTLVHVYNGGEFKIGDWSIHNYSKVYITDNATLKVSNGGKIYLDQSSEIIVQNGGTLDISENGLLETSWNTKIVVKEGGKMIIRGDVNGISLGILQAMHNTEVHIEKGGQLIIEGGDIRLWDGFGRDGLANIHISGELVLNGLFKFSGNGYFQFDKDNILTQKVPFLLRGMDRGIRFIQLNNHAKLIIDKHGMAIRKGRVQYRGHGAIIVTEDEGNFGADTVLFQGLGFNAGDEAVKGSHCQLLSFDSCLFTSLNKCVTAFGLKNNGQPAITMSRSELSDYSVGVEATSLKENGITIDDCDFTGLGIRASTGLKLQYCNKVWVRSNSTVSLHSHLDEGGIYLNGCKYFILSNSTVSDNYMGIHGEGATNIFIRNSYVGNNFRGVYFPNPAIGGDKRSNGLVDVSCSVFSNNDSGIEGNQLIVNVDGAISGHSPNTFEIQDGQYHFYLQDPLMGANGVMATEIKATNNYWDDNNDERIPEQDFDYDITPVNVLVNYEPYLEWPSFACQGPVYPPCVDGDCPCDGLVLDNGEQMNDVYSNAVSLFEVDEIESAEAVFGEISTGVNLDNLPNIEGECITKYLISTVFAAPSEGAGGNAQLITGLKEIKAGKHRLQAVPNPTTGDVVIHGERGTYQAHLYDHTGQAVRVMDAFKVPGKMKMQTVAKGIYILQLINEETGQSSSVKIVKQ